MTNHLCLCSSPREEREWFHPFHTKREWLHHFEPQKWLHSFQTEREWLGPSIVMVESELNALHTLNEACTCNSFNMKTKPHAAYNYECYTYIP